MVLATSGPLLTPPLQVLPPPRRPRSYSAITPPRYGNQTPPPPVGSCSSRREGVCEARTGPRQTQTRCVTPATARLRRGSQLTTLQPTKRQPAAGAVERGVRVTTARQTTTRAAPGCSPEDAHAAARPQQHPHASPDLTNNDRLRWKTDDRPPVNGPPTTALILLLSKHSTPPLPNTCPAPSAATLTILSLVSKETYTSVKRDLH